MTKQELNEIMKEFIQDCKETESCVYKNRKCEPSFRNFIEWLDNNTWYME